MGSIERRWLESPSRRQALLALGALLAGAPRVRGQLDPRRLDEHRRVPGLDEMMTAFDFEPVCFANMPLRLYDYMAHGGGSEWTLRRNRRVFDWVDIVPKSGMSVDEVDTRTSLLGLEMESPLMVAPSSRHVQLHPDAEAGTYRGATAARVPMIVSHYPSLSHEKIAAAADGPLWIQYYPNPDMTLSRRRLEMFQAAGPRAMVITVDQQAARYERDLHDRHLGGYPIVRDSDSSEEDEEEASTSGPELYGLPVPGRLWYNWEHLDQLRELIKVPVLVKGILTAEDARICIERGFDGVIVSNHGGRTLDYVPSTLEVLQEIVAEVKGAIPVIVDSGFRRGSDVFKALALGAEAVCLGRTVRWGLGAFGELGVERLLEILKRELRETMAENGRRTLADLDPSAVRTDFP
jgi:4-hydroxymandelate oxidase